LLYLPLYQTSCLKKSRKLYFLAGNWLLTGKNDHIWTEEKPGRGGRVTTRLCFMKKIILLALLYNILFVI
jgi:hypothetical protein